MSDPLAIAQEFHDEVSERALEKQRMARDLTGRVADAARAMRITTIENNALVAANAVLASPEFDERSAMECAAGIIADAEEQILWLQAGQVC